MNAEPRPVRVPIGPLVAAIGAVLLIVSLFLDWYDGVTGFTVFEFIDLLLVLLALTTIASLVRELGLLPSPVSPKASFAAALFTLFVVVSQILNDPPAVSDPGPAHATGIWLALGGSALMVVGALLGYAQISLAIEARRRPAAGESPPTGSPERP